jgi:hypothetical protein
MLRVAANILNQQSWIADKGYASSLPQHEKVTYYTAPIAYINFSKRFCNSDISSLNL